ncbi:MAG: hypothetical protein ABG776_01560 [Cyanobacteria bacterium J06555_13]
MILKYLKHNPSTHERVVRTISLFGVEVKVLKDLSIFDEVTLKEEYPILRCGKRTLRDTAYLNYMRPQLYPLLKGRSYNSN